MTEMLSDGLQKAICRKIETALATGTAPGYDLIKQVDLHRLLGNMQLMMYWVSQGNKWCDFCKIFIANNPSSIRTHEFGQRHKENVAKKLASIRKENAAKEKEKQQALKDFDRIEVQALRRYEKDLAEIKKTEAASTVSAGQGSSLGTGPPNAWGEWSYTDASGYYFNAATGYYYDPNSRLYYSDHHGRWITEEDATELFDQSQREMVSEAEARPRDPVPPSTQIKERKGRPSSLEVGKRKRPEKVEPVSKEELAALAAREAARKRV